MTTKKCKKHSEMEKLTISESGKIKGGFKKLNLETKSDLIASNQNCLGGGWGDTNTNCTGNCSCSSSTITRGSGSQKQN